MHSDKNVNGYSETVTLNSKKNYIDILKRRTKEVLQEQWLLQDTHYVSSRMVFIFESAAEYGDPHQVRVTVSRTFQDPEAEAWRILDDIVK